MSHDHATVAEEEYLQIIFWLQEAGLPMTGANVARAMQVSAPTVHEMIGRLESDGYVTRADDKSLSFTETGREHAEDIVRRHRLIERFLTDVFDIPWDQVHEEAERLEHWMSPTVEEKMLKAIGDADTCPHGHPIFSEKRVPGVPLADVEEGAKVRVLRFENEAEDLLHYLKDSGLAPGLEGKLERGRGGPGHDQVQRRLLLGHPQRRGDRLGGGRPVTAAARGAARPARARQGALGALDRLGRDRRPGHLGGYERAVGLIIYTMANWHSWPKAALAQQLVAPLAQVVVQKRRHDRHQQGGQHPGAPSRPPARSPRGPPPPRPR